ncbi:MAG TPA: cupin domain-containing protein [Acidobacteriaceae bacterium]|jgi:gentisate 1,2-dioxygenase|nr:cupin domain-containing protein [Acidobacteriaceae bacterium]
MSIVTKPGIGTASTLPAEPRTNNSFQQAALLFEYSSAADPIKSGSTPGIPYAEFTSELYASGPSRIIPLDLSQALHCAGPATGPSLAASFIRLEAGHELETRVNATSELFYVIQGKGTSTIGDHQIAWSQGDFFTLPGGAALHRGLETSALYWVNDQPLLEYLGVQRKQARFAPAHYTRSELAKALQHAADDPRAATRSRISLILGNPDCMQTKTVTHVLWAMYGLVEPHTRQLPHRHQSVAVDLIIDAKPGCYTLVGTELNKDGNIKNPTRVDWKSGSVFVTPPGYWHEHWNESNERAYLTPIQDAGLHTYLRTLDITFYKEDK